ncbi:5'-3' exonuclease H3TH domain-containing protein [Victivallis sp. Marseille-Q1083]|uniref:5'-3' exonuclease n=1 Tax=Victivallis sp. Marseille-Q1083 TaxID=2717288 RepID=UPI0015891B83|nr:5'-3' exonuclease H3TH domain-containing protein [Victivallis sp. Marseille-Q1083]
MKKLILIDAYSQIFRCFYAIRALSNSRQQPTNAIFAFARLLLQLQQEHPSESGAMLFDCGKPAFRLELAPDYKANRPPMPEELRSQLPWLRQLAEAFGWPLYEVENYEADDLVGAMALQAVPDYEVEIISSDKDLSQLVSSRVCMLVPDRLNRGFERRGVAEVETKFGVKPEQIVEYLALLGDSSDNIPGVAGVGPKTAATLLREVGSLSRFWDRPDLVANVRLREKLLNSRELLARNIRLIQLRTEWPTQLPPLAEAIRRREPVWPAIRQIAVEMELKSLLREIPDSAVPAKETDDLFGNI